MTRLAGFSALVLTLLALLTATAFGASLSGTYVTTVKNAGFLNGTYHISFHPGKFTLTGPYDLSGQGTYSLSGSKITLHGPGSKCTSAGTYTYSISGSSLTFHKIHDVCPRAAVLTAHSLKRT